MPTELSGAIEVPPEIHVEIAGVGPMGPPGNSPYIGENGNWWVGSQDTGVSSSGSGVTDHESLTGRDKADQHPIEAVAGLKKALNTIPPVVEPITNTEMEELLK